MKKLLIPALLLLGIVAFTGCKSNKQKKASATAREYSEYIMIGDYDGLVDRMVADNDFDSRELRQDKRRYSEMLRHNVGEHVKRNGGIKKIDVISEKTAPDGNSANVVVRHNYNNGVAEDISYDLLYADNEWKVKMGPHKEVWRTKLPDGTHVGFKLKENDGKEVFKQHIGDERDFVKIKESEDGDRAVLKVKEDGEKDVIKVKEKDDEIVVKEKHDGEKEVKHIKKDE
ncbi:MAG: hypothetical protein LIO77_04350 [Rikenellaceae bacterium]|nr:hypothetical protein [Rikenellaceae bacterium]